jgi:3-hydroxy-9,10-secoandrosta-1,3,5(10)-triene-9,17-dione monooxygenase
MKVSDLVTREGALEKARELVPILKERASRAEELRRLPEETVRDFVDSGLLRLVQPRRWGGAELPLSVHLEVTAELGRGCGSSAWGYSIFASHFWQLSLFPQAAQEAVWGHDPATLICTSAVGGPPPRRVDGGVHIEDSRWTFLSGVDYAEWVAVNGVLPPQHAGGHPDARFLLVKKGAFEIIDDWHTASLRGTGSKSVRVRDVFVPDEMQLSFASMREGNAPGAAVNPGPNYRLPLVAGWLLFLAAPAVGIARGALETWIEKTRTRAYAYTGQPVREQPLSHLRLGEAAAMIDAGHELMRRDILEATAVVDAGGEVSRDLRARCRRDYCFATQLCIDAVGSLFLSSGGGSLYDSSEMQRFWRDVHGVGQHAALNYDAAVSGFGRHVFGLPPEGPGF